MRETRYQAAILQDQQILLIKTRDHRFNNEFWLLPEGAREDGETEELCVKREVFEETHLEVDVLGLLYQEPAPLDEGYRRAKTYLCRPLNGVPRPGLEPEMAARGLAEVVDLRWFDLWDESDGAKSSKRIRSHFPRCSGSEG